MDMGRGLLAVWMDVKPEFLPEGEAELNRWYTKSHLPERAIISGVIRARRYLSVEGAPRFCAIYDMENLDVIQSEPYKNLRNSPDREWSRSIGQTLATNIRREYELLASAGELKQEPSPFVYIERHEIAPEHEDALNDWYNNDLLPAVAAVPGVLGARRYEIKVGNGPKYLALYELESAEVTHSPEWKAATESGKATELRPLLTNLEANLGQLIESLP